MIIGVPSEVKNNENRVGLTPNSVQSLVSLGHDVLIQNNAGANIGFLNDQYIAAGAKLIDTAEDVYKSSEMIVKVKEPIPDEYKIFRDDLTSFTYLSLAGDPENAKKII
jgi:Alanine dehydrogenase